MKMGNGRVSFKSLYRRSVFQFRNLVRPYLGSAYMKEDIYLIRWIRVTNFDVQKAKQRLLENLRWRKANNMDTINTEDWSDMQLEYPLYTDTVDKEGRPVGTVNLGTWNFRRAAVTGKMPRMIRYFYKLLEESTQTVIRNQYKGANVTEFSLIMNLDGFNAIQHACPACLQAYRAFVTAYQNYYVGYTHKITLINTPPIFKTVLDVIQPLFTARTKEILKIFGPNKKEWQEYLDKEISRDALRPEYGGTRSD
ncbi:unnamed protein product [Orchesella dallaii]|uniref:CRAL-TRIO domain-containing protein n=1 Tax=Orchesella dallaii TaxID=48710 RepID=A0ABP1Q8P3_9HEXA